MSPFVYGSLEPFRTSKMSILLVGMAERFFLISVIIDWRY